MSTPIAWMPWRCRTGTQRFTASASSMKVTFSTPAGETMVGVVSVTTPISAIFLPPPTLKTWYGGRAGLLVPLTSTFAARYGNWAPLKAEPLLSVKQPVTSFCTPSQAVTSSLYVPSVAAEMRRSSSVPRSNSWLPTEETSRPIVLRTSIVGSSLKTLELNGEALIRSPAPTKNEDASEPPPLTNAARVVATVLATLAAPPTVVVLPSGLVSVASVPVVSEIRPWKSFMASNWTGMSAYGFGAAEATEGAAIRPTDVASARAAARERRVLLKEVLQRTCGNRPPRGWSRRG